MLDSEVNAKDKSEKGRIHLVMDASDAFWVKRDDFAIKLATELSKMATGRKEVILWAMLKYYS